MRIFRSSDAVAGPGDPATSLGSLTVQRLASQGTHIAVNLNVNGPTIWLERVSDDEYGR